ncbi:hypothetical protein DBR47_24405 [Paucibacter sp. KBW04]|uniref:DUF1173 family protein n=1 Tax=Paucibacter sp. KBW04 TaxID=2153361 RepID=UPI000F58AE16|nr:DUF1173 family protein [Paucibacter sp. KBW04]RQO53246.1 hypothetical protein DBR47_24405 [Paucibacter sp. KBW04]
MNTLATPQVQLQIEGRLHSANSTELGASIGNAYSRRHRPRCMCTSTGAEMYIARLGDGYLVKRMPGTGSEHAPTCPSYEPAAEFSGLAQVLGTAIVEDPETGLTQLRLDFPMSKGTKRLPSALAGEPSSSAKSSGTRLSLRGLLHYLWDQADLSSWSPDQKDGRTWPFVRNMLLRAMTCKTLCGRQLSQQLYIPEPFFVDRREAINARRAFSWQVAQSGPLGRSAMILIIAELKELAPTRFGHRALVKHLPDTPLLVDEQLFRKMSRQFGEDLLLWGASDALRAILIGTLVVGTNGTAQLNEVSLMLTNQAWTPVANVYEQQLLDLLMSEGRSFNKPLAYNLARSAELPSALLKDAGPNIVPLQITLAGEPLSNCGRPGPIESHWHWDPSQSASIPPFPSTAGSS